MHSGGSIHRVLPPVCLALVVLANACATSREPRLGEPVVVTRPESDTEFTEGQRAEIEERLRKVEILLVREDFDTALEIVDAELARDLPGDLAARLRGVRLTVRQRRHEHPPLEGRLQTDRDLYAFGDEIRLALMLVNRTDREVRIPLAAPDSSRGYLFLRIVRREIDVYGNTREDVEQGRRELPGHAVIPPGETRWSEFGLPVGSREHDGLTEFRITGHIRPSVVRVGEREDFRSIPLGEVVVKVLPRNYEPLARDPLGALRKALDKRAALHLLVAAELVSTADRPEAVRLLVESLRPGQDVLSCAAIAALRRLTGEILPLVPAAWTRWWDHREVSRRE